LKGEVAQGPIPTAVALADVFDLELQKASEENSSWLLAKQRSGGT
jgi:hypothetical protein